MSAYDKAVDLLSRREHTRKELESKLKEKGFGDEDIEEAVTTLISEGYLSDERFAEVYIRFRIRKAAEGRSILIMRLTEKGVPKSLASSMVNKAWEEEEYLPTLIREWSKLSRKYGDGKAVQKLIQKGFTVSEIRKAEKESRDED